METILNTVLSENWIMAFLFILTLIGFYKIAKWFGASYLKLQEEHNVAFLWSFNNMIEKISDGDTTHSKEHISIMEFLNEKHTTNSEEHIKIINLVWEIDGNVKENAKNISNISKEILHINK